MLQVKQHTFRESFRKKAPLFYDSTNVYSRIDKVCTKSTVLYNDCLQLLVGSF